jgi:hypothetical protein
MQLNESSLHAGDLRNLVDHIFEIDSYKSKMGEDKDIVVVSFTVENQSPAKDLVSFIEKGYDFILDADVTPGELSNGKYKVFVELQRDRHVNENIVNMLYGIGKLAEIDGFKFRYYKSFNSLDATKENLEEAIPNSAQAYEQRLQEKTLESYHNFFANSMLESIAMENNTIEFKKKYAEPLRFRYVNSGSATQILESIEDKIAIGLADIADVMFLTKYIGNYNITKLGSKFMFEHKNYAIILEKI